MDTTMKIEEMTDHFDLPNIPGIIWRGFQGESDYARIHTVVHACKEADGVQRSDSVEQIANNYTHLHHCNPATDMLMADTVDGLAGYTRVWWAVQGDGTWTGFSIGYVRPECRRKGIGTALLRFGESRLRQIANQLMKSGELPDQAKRVMDSFLSESELDTRALLEKNGFKVIRHNFEMVRPDLENIPDLPLTPGVEVRAYQPEHLRAIWEASNEAFQDHWGYIPDPWEDYVRMQSDPTFDPSLWRVAWQGNQVAGMVLSYIVKAENEEYGRLRGYTENICVRRQWRKQGLAKALIARSLQALKERGMKEAALGVDAQNISGATHLYELMGYRVTKQGGIYRKELDI
jgi:ribosomal protein S18 acetylase RimI-like enzyme